MKRIVVAYPSAARTASPTDAIVDTMGFNGCTVMIDATAITATPSVVFNINGRDPVSGAQWLIIASAAVVAISDIQIDIFPGSEEAANLSENATLPLELVIDPVHGDADSITYSVNVVLF